MIWIFTSTNQCTLKWTKPNVTKSISKSFPYFLFPKAPQKKNTLLRVIPAMTWHSYLAFLSGILLWHSIWHSIGRSIWHSMWHIFWHSLRNTWRGFSRLRSGREHLAWILAVDPGNTWRGFSRLRSGREHLAWMVVAEVRRWRKAAEGGRRKSTDLKSKNPHLAGGEIESC